MARDLLLIEDDERFASIVRMLLEAEAFQVQWARCAREARALIASTQRFDLAIVDLALPDAHGIEIVRELATHTPPIPALVLTGLCAQTLVLDALCAGACGYLYKQDLARRLISALDEIVGGGLPLSVGATWALVSHLRATAPQPSASSPIAPRTASADPPLTEREREVLCELARGLTYEQIGLVLGISENTIRTHVRALYRKLDAGSRTEAILCAVRRGLITLC